MAFIINWYKQLSFFRKQLLVATVVTCITLLMASLMLYGKYVSDYKANLLEQVTGKAQLIAVTSRSALLFDDTQTAIDILNSLETFANIQFGVLLDAEQEVFAQFRHSGFTEQHQASLPELTKLSPGNAFMEGFLYVYQPVVMDGEKTLVMC